jgi:hypothetical protein
VAATAACGSVNKAKPDAAPVPDAAVDAPPDPLDGAKSGTRIKLQWFVFDDGTKQFSGFYDSQLSSACSNNSFYGDTHTYCIPQYMGVNYSDAACSQKIALSYNNQCAATRQTYTFAAETMSMSCMYGVTHLYHLGAVASGVTNYYYKDGTGTCQNGGALGTNYTAYSVGAEVTTSGLAEMTLGTPTAGAVGVVSLQTADGLNYPQNFHDSAGGFDCYGSYNYQGATTAMCVPNNSGYAGYYSDNGCTSHEMIVGPGCTPPPYAFKPSRDNCSVDPYEVDHGASLISPTPASYYYWNPSSQTCIAQTIPTGYTFYDLGTAITLQSLMRKPDAIPGHRVQGIQMSSGESRMRDYTMYDKTLGSECYIQQMGDGTYRCMPENAYIQQPSNFYTDSTCSTSATFAQAYKGGSASCASPPAPGYAYANVTVGNCYDYNIYQVGAKYTGTVYYMNGTCMPYPSAGQYDWYMLGPQVPTIGLAAATLQNDP